MSRADRRGDVARGAPSQRIPEREPTRPRQMWRGRAEAEVEDEGEDASLGGRVWAMRCAGVLCEAPSPDRADHPAPHVGYMSATLAGVESDWPL